MAFNEVLADRIKRALAKEPGITSKKMFGGIAFMKGDKMCVGVIKDDLMLRLDPKDAEKALADPSARPMDFTGRPMQGYIYVNASGYKSDAALKKWVMPSVQYAASLSGKKKK